MPQQRPGINPTRAVLASVAPGTALRAGLERILASGTGALIVLGMDEATDALCDGGFRLDLPFSPTQLRELAKMDGAVLLSADLSRLLGANIQLMPDASIPTVESGTRHRTAERVATQTGHPVIAVSHSMNTISLYFDGVRHHVTDSATILTRANQALATLQRYRMRLDEVTRELTIAEIEDTVVLREAVTAIQRLLMVEMIDRELCDDLVELGSDGRLLGMQLDEMMAGIESLGSQLLLDYLPDGMLFAGVTDVDDPDRDAPESTTPDTASVVARVAADLHRLSARDLIDLSVLARHLGYDAHSDTLESSVGPRGHRLLAQVPHVPAGMLARVAEQFGSLQAVLAATLTDLQSVDGIGETRARAIREAVAGLVDGALSDRPRGGW